MEKGLIKDLYWKIGRTAKELDKIRIDLIETLSEIIDNYSEDEMRFKDVYICYDIDLKCEVGLVSLSKIDSKIYIVMYNNGREEMLDINTLTLERLFGHYQNIIYAIIEQHQDSKEIIDGFIVK